MVIPIAVAISDIHFNLNTLSIASKALRSALKKAEDLKVPLIIAGDLNDTKAIIRAEVANELINILENAKVVVYLLCGNHDLCNEKGKEHGLNYLKTYTSVISSPVSISGFNFVPYQASKEAFKEAISQFKGLVFCHQGIKGAFMGDYIRDDSSIDPDDIKDVKIISGHYHKHQTVGPLTYIGSPYTVTFGEANDGPKGFLVVNSDGTFTREILDLRKHVILQVNCKELEKSIVSVNENDLLWVKVSGSKAELNKLNKIEIGKRLIGHSNYKLDKIYTDEKIVPIAVESKSYASILDDIIDANYKDATDLKALWRQVVE